MTGKELVSRIDALLKARNQKRLALANHLNIAPQSFTDWDKRGNFPKADVLYKISQYFGVSMEYLVTGVEPEQDARLQQLKNKIEELNEFSKSL